MNYQISNHAYNVPFLWYCRNFFEQRQQRNYGKDLFLVVTDNWHIFLSHYIVIFIFHIFIMYIWCLLYTKENNRQNKDGFHTVAAASINWHILYYIPRLLFKIPFTCFSDVLTAERCWLSNIISDWIISWNVHFSSQLSKGFETITSQTFNS